VCSPNYLQQYTLLYNVAALPLIRLNVREAVIARLLFYRITAEHAAAVAADADAVGAVSEISLPTMENDRSVDAFILGHLQVLNETVLREVNVHR